MYCGTKAQRFELYKQEFVSPTIPLDEQIPLTSYYPTGDYKSVVNEIAESFPLEFIVTGDNADFVTSNLIENSYFKKSYSLISKECVLSPRCFTAISTRIDVDNKGKDVLVFDLKVLEYEKCIDYYDSSTGNLTKLIYQTNEQAYNSYGDLVNAKTTTIYTMDTITKEYFDGNNERIIGLETVTVDNPFKEYGVMPVLVFESISYDDKPIAYEFIEQQHQIDNLNFNIENGINYQGMPVWKIKKTMRDWNGMAIAPNSVVPLRGEEDLESVGGTGIQIDSFRDNMKYKVDKLYMQAGLMPPSLRERVFGTDSSGVAKLAQAPLISKIKIIMSFHKKPLNDLAKMILALNGETYTNEKVEPPNEVLPFNLQEVLSSFAMGMNLGLFDDELFWTKYYPSLTDTDKARIRKFKADNAEMLNMKNTNTNNTAKTTVPAGNKKKATKMTKEERDVNVTK